MWPRTFFDLLSTPSRLVQRLVWIVLPAGLRSGLASRVTALEKRADVDIPKSQTRIYAKDDEFKARFAGLPFVNIGTGTGASVHAMLNRKYSLVATTKNEATTCNAWLTAIAKQSAMPDEIIICDGGSVDGTVEIIEAWAEHYNNSAASEKSLLITVLRGGPLNIAQGRNRAVEAARNEIILFSDFGSEPETDWAELLLLPFSHESETEISMGWYYPRLAHWWSSDLARFLVPKLDAVDPSTFLPSARSLAVKRECWRKVGGFPEYLTFAGEDTLFGYYLKYVAKTWAFVPDARVRWSFPASLSRAYVMTKRYAQGDGEGGKLFVGRYLWLLRHGLSLTIEMVLFLAAICWHVGAESDRSLFVMLFAAVVVISRLVVIAKPYGVFDRWRAQPVRSVITFSLWLGIFVAQAVGYSRGLFSRGSVEARRIAAATAHYIFVLTEHPLFSASEKGTIDADLKLALFDGAIVVNLFEEPIASGERVFDHPHYESYRMADFDGVRWGDKHRKKLEASTVEVVISDEVKQSQSASQNGILIWINELGRNVTKAKVRENDITQRDSLVLRSS